MTRRPSSPRSIECSSPSTRSPSTHRPTKTEDGFADHRRQFRTARGPGRRRGAIEAELANLDAPVELRIAVEPVAVEPDVTIAEAEAARAMAERMIAPVVLKDGDETWTIKKPTVRKWIGFAMTEQGYRPVVDEAAVRTRSG